MKQLLRKFLRSIFVCTLLCSIFLQAQKWDILIYADSSHVLSHAVIKNITDLLKGRLGQSTPDINISIQLHCLGKDGDLGDEVYRYKVVDSSLVLSEYAKLTYNQVDDAVSAARWAFSGDPDAYTMIVFWNHGSGVLNPTYQEVGEGNFEWLPEQDELMMESCVFKRSLRKHHDEHHRGLMFQKEPKCYMTTQELMKTIKTIRTEILEGRKIDIVGMDMCMMSMVEIGYELSPYVHYMVGSQDCELEYGWDYEAIFKALGSTVTEPDEVAQAIVEAYRYFYSTYAIRGTYTHAATDLSYMPELKQNFDLVVGFLKEYLLQNPDAVETLTEMRRDIPRFCLIPMYTDLYTVYEKLEELMANNDEALAALAQGKELIQNAVIDHCEGQLRTFARGLSIYFPISHIDSSYYSCQFAQDTQWLDALGMVTGEEEEEETERIV